MQSGAGSVGFAISRGIVQDAYGEAHAARVLAQWLLDEGLLRGSLDAVMESHAAAVFFPHGVGHLLGLDTHDLEQFWDLAGYAPGRERDPHFGTAYLRMDLDLEPGMCFTVEPGLYIAADDEEADERFRGIGVRIEDDVHITAEGCENLTAAIPKAPDDVEALVAEGP